jgi:2-polyprenyl-3-methyl-5-hydroxy-6-metoxy-1,4-benzoquinol methylase
LYPNPKAFLANVPLVRHANRLNNFTVYITMYENLKNSDLAEFRCAYAAALADVQRHWTNDMQLEVARHNSAWRPGSTDFIGYMRASRIRYEQALDLLGGIRNLGPICDIGGFLGLFPLTLAKLGVKTSMTEALKYYSSAFTPQFEMLEQNGIEVIDYDPFESDPGQHVGRFAAVTVMAVLEHYPHSPASFMNHVKKMMAPSGRILIEVPNIAFWPKRMALLRGKSPLVPLTAKLNSNVPFIGHHHEYSCDDLYALFRHSGLDLLSLRSFNYSLDAPLLNRLLTEPTMTISSWLLPNARETLVAVASAGNQQ